MGKNFDSLCKDFKVSDEQKKQIENIMNDYMNKTENYTWRDLRIDFLNKANIGWDGLKLSLRAFYNDKEYEYVIIKFLEDYKNNYTDPSVELKGVYEDLCMQGKLKCNLE